MDSKKIVVTGANGFLGANLTREFLNCGYEMYPFVRESSNLWRIAEIIDELNVIKLSESSRTEYAKLFSAIKPDVIINAMGADQKSILNDGALNWKSNFLSLVELANGMTEMGDCVFIHAGSSFEYGRTTLKSNPVSESSMFEPVSEYAIAKLFATNYLKYITQWRSNSIFDFLIFNLYGPYESHERLIPDVILKSIQGEKIVLKNPSVARDFIYIKDVTEAFDTVIKDCETATGLNILNLGTGVGSKISDVAYMINGLNGNKSKIEFSLGDQRPENSIPGPIADMKKTQSILKWKPKYDIRRGFLDQNNWFSKHLDIYGIDKF